MSKALAHVNYGRWIAQCPAEGCYDALLLVPGQLSMTCAVGHTSPVDWPSPAAVTAITDALAKRPEEKNRGWYPANHPFAMARGIPNGQTPADLDAETAEHAEADNAKQVQRRKLRGILDELGITVRPDGTIEGKV